MRTAFIGHRTISANIFERLVDAIQLQIENGCTSFIMGTHGTFDELSLRACRILRNTYKNIQIEIVITNLNVIKNNYDLSAYSDVSTVIFDIENVYFKKQIISSNKQMIDTCDTLICYVDTNISKSGAKTTMQYAQKKGVKIVNLYHKEDNIFYSMTKEEKDNYWKNFPYNKK